MLGGGLRQAGILAAAGIHALDNHIDRMKTDHANIEKVIKFMQSHPALEVELPTPHPTNILYFSFTNPEKTKPQEILAQLAQKGIQMIELSPNRVRMVTHINISEEDVDFAIEAFKQALA